MAELMNVNNLLAMVALLLLGYVALLVALMKRVSVPVPGSNPMERPHVTWTASYEGKGTVTLYFGSDTDARDAYLWLLATRPRMKGQVPLPAINPIPQPQRQTGGYGDAQKVALLRAMQEITSLLNLPTNSTCQDVVDEVQQLSSLKTQQASA